MHNAQSKTAILSPLARFFALGIEHWALSISRLCFSTAC
jgi:hypothetical protein